MAETYQSIGKRIRRPDAAARLTGHEPYTADLTLPGMLHARLVLSSEARANVRSINREAALAIPGVAAIVTADDLPEFARDDDQVVHETFFLAHRRVNYVGQPVAVALADTPEAAEAAADLVRIDYDPLPLVVDPGAALDSGAPVLRETMDSNQSAVIRYERGDIDRAFENADVTVEREFRSNAVYQSYLEPRAVVASPDGLGRLTIYTPTQGQFMVRSMVARALRRPEQDIAVQPMTVGGGFGAKFVLFEPLVALLAIQAGQPVKLVLDRSEDFIGTIHAPEAILRIALAASTDGKIAGMKANLIYGTGFFSHSPYQGAAIMLGSWYPAPNLSITSTEVYTNRCGAAAYRAPGLTAMAFAVEQLIDELAGKLGASPIDLRLLNAATSGAPMADGNPWPPHELPRVLEAAKEHPLWRAPRAAGEGIGIAMGMMRGSSEPASATARLIADGALSVTVGSIDITGTNTGLTQIAAEAFGVPVEQVRVTTAPSDVAPHSGGSGGSKILYTLGNAVIVAVREARDQALALAAGELEVSPDDLEIFDGGVRVIGSPDRTLTFREIVARTSGMGARYAPVHGHGNVANTERAPGGAVHIARVRVDHDTGEVQVTGYAALHDVGRAINPAEVEGQIHGGFAQGIGWALFEAHPYDERGQPVAASYMDYALPKATQTPAIESAILEFPAPDGPFGAKGIGEPPVVPVAAAIANAIHDATGVRLTELPMTQERVWRALRAGSTTDNG